MDVWQFEVWQVLLRAPEILHHGAHEELVLLLKGLVDSFQLCLEFVQVRRHLACTYFTVIIAYLKHTLEGSRAVA
jgi:hypothetical protein